VGYAVAGVLLITLLSAATGGFAAKLLTRLGPRHEESLRRSVESLEGIVTKMHGEDPIMKLVEKSMIKIPDLLRIEGEVRNGADIWVLTSFLDFEEQELHDTIRSNFKRGVRYTYFIPKEDTWLHERMKALARVWKDDCSLSAAAAQTQIRCFLVPKNITYMTIIVYDPYGNDKDREVLIEIPSLLVPNEKYSLFYRVNHEPQQARSRFLSAIQDMLGEKEQGFPGVEHLEMRFS
jgi:hypothetical protein